jgi:hypothetical protein
MDADPAVSSGFRRSCPRRSGRTALPPAACPPMSRDTMTGRAAAGRAGSFNSDSLTHRGPSRVYVFN